MLEHHAVSLHEQALCNHNMRTVCEHVIDFKMEVKVFLNQNGCYRIIMYIAILLRPPCLRYGLEKCRTEGG